MSDNPRFCLICGQILDSRNKGISCHKFPKNRENEWLELFDLNSESLKVKVEIAQLCSRHFTPDCFTVAKNGSKLLKKNSIPTIRFIDENDLCVKKTRLCQSTEHSEIDQTVETQENYVIPDHIHESTIAPISKYSNYAKTCILCGRQRELKLSFFNFPKDSRRETWLKACNISEEIPANARLCSRHFRISDYYTPPGSSSRAFLTKTAVPSIFFDLESTYNQNNPECTAGRCDKRIHHNTYFEKQSDHEMLTEDNENSDLSERPTINIERRNDNFKINIEETIIIKVEEDPLTLTSANPHQLIKIERPLTPLSYESHVSHDTNAVAADSPQVSLHEHAYTPLSTLPRKRPRYPGDIGTAHASDPRTAIMCINFLKNCLSEKNHIIHKLQKKINRQEKRITSLLETGKFAKQADIKSNDSAKQTTVSRSTKKKKLSMVKYVKYFNTKIVPFKQIN